MTSRERVMTAFAHREPDRVPRWCGASPEFWEKAKRQLRIADDESLRRRMGDDFRRVWPRYAGPKDLSPTENLPAGMTWRTPFGIVRHGIGYGQPVSHPLARATLQEVHDYPWPDARWTDVSAIRDEALAWGRQYAVLGGDWSPFWHDAIDLFGMENLFYKMFDEPEVVDAAIGHIVDYYAAVSERIFEAAGDAIDIFFIGNDFGSRSGPLLSPAQFDRFMLPHLKRLIDLGHAYGLKVMLHCCGGFEPLLPALIAAGLDGVHAIQPCCAGMELRNLKAKYGDRILFNGAIDSHHVLIEGTPETVRQRTREVLAIMAPGGGYVAGASHDWILEETPVENVLAMFDTVEEFRLE
jgi:uroporphyrinogen decarboxylase